MAEEHSSPKEVGGAWLFTAGLPQEKRAKWGCLQGMHKLEQLPQPAEQLRQDASQQTDSHFHYTYPNPPPCSVTQGHIHTPVA